MSLSPQPDLFVCAIEVLLSKNYSSPVSHTAALGDFHAGEPKVKTLFNLKTL